MGEWSQWIHDVEPSLQANHINGCWWACCQMLFRYQRSEDRFIERPGQVDAVFRERHGAHVQSEAELRFDLRGLRRPYPYRMTDRREQPLHPSYFMPCPRFLHPSHWWRLGIPPDPCHLVLLSRVCSLRPLRDVARSPYDPQTWIDAIRHRPMFLVFMVQNRQCHAVVGSGVRYPVERNGAPDLASAEVRILDPNSHALSGWYAIAELQLLAPAQTFAAMHYRGGTYRAATHSRAPQ